MLLTITSARSHLSHEVNRAALRLYLQTEAVLEGWTASPWQIQVDDKELGVVKELIQELTEQLQREVRVWVCSVLQPLLQEELHALVSALLRQSEPCGGLRLDARSPRQREQELDRIIQEALDRSATAIREYEGRACSVGILLVRLLEMASIQAALGRGAAQEELREVVGWAYRRELLASLGERAKAIVTIVEQECCRVEVQVMAALQADGHPMQETRWDHALIRS